MVKRTRRGGFERRHRVGEEIRHALAEIFARGDIHDPVLRDGAVTVTEVELGADLRHATAYVLPFGTVDAHEMLAGLVRTTPFLRREVSRRVRLKYMPSLAFALDRRFEHAERIDALLRRPEVARDIAGPRPDGPANGHEPEAEG